MSGEIAKVRRIARKPVEFDLDKEEHALAMAYANRLGRGHFGPTVIKWLAAAERHHQKQLANTQHSTVQNGSVRMSGK